MNFFQKSTKQETDVDFFVNPQAEKRKSFSKYFYFISGVLIMVLLLEGGYLFYLHQKKKELSARNDHLQNVNWVGEDMGQIVLEKLQDDLKGGEDFRKRILIKGEVKEIEERTISLFMETSNFPILVRVNVYPDATFMKANSPLPGDVQLLEGDHFTDIKVGSRVVFSELLPGKDNLFGSKKVIFEE